VLRRCLLLERLLRPFRGLGNSSFRPLAHVSLRISPARERATIQNYASLGTLAGGLYGLLLSDLLVLLFLLASFDLSRIKPNNLFLLAIHSSLLLLLALTYLLATLPIGMIFALRSEGHRLDLRYLFYCLRRDRARALALALAIFISSLVMFALGYIVNYVSSKFWPSLLDHGGNSVLKCLTIGYATVGVAAWPSFLWVFVHRKISESKSLKKLRGLRATMASHLSVLLRATSAEEVLSWLSYDKDLLSEDVAAIRSISRLVIAEAGDNALDQAARWSGTVTDLRRIGELLETRLSAVSRIKSGGNLASAISWD
jgi:hypothetical protein